ncbi:murein L,D-transpeptidase [Qipengyuania marisflavi]|uniref:Murein L,D-transpeptidase n=2 Tax=Qipengyuania marisflavi TaxID=2486356 RepID=A0A5S3Q276_9SPHN|nr:murein L,D-transpeptidase [Qipengyuania marisflavi]
MSGQDNDKTATDTAASAGQTGTDYGYQTYGDDNYADSMASKDDLSGDMAGADSDAGVPDSEERPVMQAQVVLDRLGFGPGVIDGKMGMSTENALRGFQLANDFEATGKLDEKTKAALGEWERIPATRVVTIPTDWNSDSYQAVPDDAADQAKMKRLGYESLDERLAERFHTTVAVLKQLNPNGRPAGMDASAAAKPTATSSAKPTPSASASASDAAKSTGPKSYFAAGQQIRVPNIGGDKIKPGAIDSTDWQRTLASLGVGTEQPEVAKVVVSKGAGTLKAFDKDNKLVALFTVTTGSNNDPLPLGDWKITGVAKNPPFAYNPELFWDVSDETEKQQLPPGPNGPVGVVWIDLSKEHYGIHGTPAPETIGRAQSHGCVRLTNWDAARLSQMVSTSTQVLFEA